MKRITVRNVGREDWNGRYHEVEFESCEQCGASIMVSDLEAVEQHRSWHVAMERIRSRF
jgi:hypothetical protein